MTDRIRKDTTTIGEALIADVVSQDTAARLLDRIEDGGVLYASDVMILWPVLWGYLARERWAMVMHNGVARATAEGAAVRRFVRLPPVPVVNRTEMRAALGAADDELRELTARIESVVAARNALAAVLGVEQVDAESLTFVASSVHRAQTRGLD